MNSLSLSHSMTHYLLVIHKLKERRGYARVTDISKALNLTKGSVSTAVHNLKKKNLIAEEEDSKFLNLTTQGHEVVHEVLSNRILLYHFFHDLLGVESKKALRGACDMEHLVGSEIRKELFYLMRTLTLDEESPEKIIFMKRISNLKIDLSLEKFNSLEEFVENQSSDFEEQWKSEESFDEKE